MIEKRVRITEGNQKDEKRKNKLNSLRNEFEGGKIQTFGQVFAIFSMSPLAAELHIPFYSFKNKVSNPGEFTLNEIVAFSKLINIDMQLILQFIFNQMQSKKRR